MMNVSGTSSAPSLDVCVASDTSTGNSLIAYERQATTSDVPITVAYRICGSTPSISVKPDEGQEDFVIGFYPNPFNPNVNISVRSNTNDLTLKIMDAQGREVTDLTSNLRKIRKGQFYHAVWDASNQASGVYFARLVYGNKEVCRKLFLMR
jgi:hypothetical protein